MVSLVNFDQESCPFASSWQFKALHCENLGGSFGTLHAHAKKTWTALLYIAPFDPRSTNFLMARCDHQAWKYYNSNCRLLLLGETPRGSAKAMMGQPFRLDSANKSLSLRLLQPLVSEIRVEGTTQTIMQSWWFCPEASMTWTETTKHTNTFANPTKFRRCLSNLNLKLWSCFRGSGYLRIMTCFLAQLPSAGHQPFT